MENYSKSEILQMVEEEDVEFIRLQFTDMFGVLKNVAIPSSRLIKAWRTAVRSIRHLWMVLPEKRKMICI